MARPPRLIRLADMPNSRIITNVIEGGEWQRDGDDERRAQIAEKCQQQNDDQYGRFQQRLADSADRTMDQV